MNAWAADVEGPVGLVGLGLVGQALGCRLRQVGFQVMGFDRSDQACAAWSAAGGGLAQSAADLGQRCSKVVLAVFDTAGVLEVVEGPAGLLDGGTLRTVIDCSTGDPQALEGLAARLSQRGVDFIEAPLSGSSQQIADGQATMLLGGARPHSNATRPCCRPCRRGASMWAVRGWAPVPSWPPTSCWG